MKLTPVLAALTVGAAALSSAACRDATVPEPSSARRPLLQPVAPYAGDLAPELRITVRSLGTLGARADGSERSEAFSINAVGAVTGSSTWPGPAGSPERVFLWTAAAGMSSGGFYGVGYGINASAQITGRNTVHDRGYLWATGTGAYTLLASTTFARNINDAGVVVGSIDVAPGREAFRWSAAGGLTSLGHGTFPRPQADARAINELGQIVGNDWGADGYDTAPWLRGTDGVRRYLRRGALDASFPYNNVWAYDVNESGAIVGSRRDRASAALLWRSADAEPEVLAGSEPGVQARAINDHGYVAGWSENEAYLWTPTGGRLTLPTLGPDYTLAHANDLNDRLDVVGESCGGVYGPPGVGCRAVLWRVRYVYPYALALRADTDTGLVRLGAGGLLSAALLSARGAEACALDPAAFTLGDGRGSDAPAARGKDGKPLASCEDVDEDGDLDLLLAFDQSALEKNKDLVPGTNVLILYGDLGNGDAVEGKAKVEVK